MPRADTEHTPSERDARYVRAAVAVEVELHQPLRRGRHRTIHGKLLGETRVNGRLHHYRVQATDGVVFITPPDWLTPESVAALDAAGTALSAAAQNAKRLATLESMARQLIELAEPESVA